MDETDGSRQAYEAFTRSLDALRTSQAQERLRAQVVRRLIKAIALGAVAGLLLVLGILFILGSRWGWGGWLTFVSVSLFVLAMTRYAWPAVLVAQEQERQYFLASIRLARNCDELGWAGLFADARGSRWVEDDDIERTRVAELAEQLQNALHRDRLKQSSTPHPPGSNPVPTSGVM